ncbi:hypothetical protein K457DRAFT_509363 [Linnemannia elongata AG-77]|uniref:Uncharacterized protein n=1 Tax=Linnemannia elongata AG-77 TaxID=1314771 RepID=A0A197JYM0_9FUNG|nr:hypothetical protein K457DRAFT_509363 [Linnemannia elongata AG-77]
MKKKPFFKTASPFLSSPPLPPTTSSWVTLTTSTIAFAPIPLSEKWINTHLINCITPPKTTPIPTFIHCGYKSRTTFAYILSSFLPLFSDFEPYVGVLFRTTTC